MVQDLFKQCKVLVKNEIKRSNKPNCKLEVVKRKDGTIFWRSCKNKPIEKLAEPIAALICKPLKKF